MFSAIFGQRIIRRRLAAFHKAASLAWEEEELADIAALVCHSSGCVKRSAGINKKISNSQAVFENGASITSTRMFRSNAMGLANSSRNEETMSDTTKWLMVFFRKLVFSIEFIKELEAFHQVIPNPFPTTKCFLKICWGLIENFIKNHIQLFIWQIRKGDRHRRRIRNPQSEFGLIDVECYERCTPRTPGFTTTSYSLWLNRCRLLQV